MEDTATAAWEAEADPPAGVVAVATSVSTAARCWRRSPKKPEGRTFEVSGKQTFAAIYTQIGEELRSQYRLGYVPDAGAAAQGFHHVQLVAARDKKLSIQTREGYYGGQ